MSKKANSAVIGGFVVGAAVLALVAVVLLGGGKFLTKKQTFVLFFDGSLKGLNVGSPVLFRGVQVGEVSDIIVRTYPTERKPEISVYIELDPSRVERVGETTPDPVAAFNAMIERGLRAKLEMQSFVTGVLAVDLDFHPDKPAVYHGDDPPYPEIPTIPSTLEEVAKTLASLPIHELFTNAEHAIKSIDELASSEDLMSAIRSLDETIKDVGELARNLDRRIGPLATSITDAANAARTTLETAQARIASIESALDDTLEEYRKLARSVDAQVAPIATDLRDTLEVARAALVQSKETLATAQEVIGRDSELHSQLVNALGEISAAARSVRLFADYLDQHPESLLQGKRSPGGS